MQECAVVASPDEIRGKIVKAFIVLRDDVDKEMPNLIETLQDHVKELQHLINILEKLNLLMNYQKQLLEK